MIISVAVQAYLARIGELLKEQGFDPTMSVIYDAEQAQTDEWISDELAGKHMDRKQMTTKDDVRKKPFMALFWTRSSLEPIVRHPWRLLDTRDDGVDGRWGKSTVNGKFRIACAFVSNKAEAVEDLEEAFAAKFQSTYNVPLSLEFIYNAAGARPEDAKINFTMIQNMGESDLLNYKEGNLFSYAWSAELYLNCVSEFAWSQVFPVEKVLVDLYGPKGIPLASLDAAGIAHTHDYTADTGEVVPDVPDEPLIAFTRAEPHDYVPFAITMPYAIPYTEWNDYASGSSEGVAPNPNPPRPFPPDKAPGNLHNPDKAPGNLHNTYGSKTEMIASPHEYAIETRELIEGAVKEIGGEISLRSTPYMVVVRVPLSDYHRLIDDKVHERLPDGSTAIRTIERESTHDEDMMEASRAIAAAVKTATGEDYVVSMFPDPPLVVYDGSTKE